MSASTSTLPPPALRLTSTAPPSLEAVERLSVMLTQEAGSYRTTDYLALTAAPARGLTKQPGNLADNDAASPRMNEQWRASICEWAFRVVDHFQLSREVVAIAMNYLDRCTAAHVIGDAGSSERPFTMFGDPVIDSQGHAVMCNKTYQLLSLTCLYISIKLNEFCYLKLPGTRSTLDTVLRLSSGHFTNSQMEDMERDVLRCLGWKMFPPTPQQFLYHFVLPDCDERASQEDQHRTGPVNENINDDTTMEFELLAGSTIEDVANQSSHTMQRRPDGVLDLALFLVELSTMDYFFVQFLPSEVARAAMHCASRWLSSSLEASARRTPTGNVGYCAVRLSQLYESQMESPQHQPTRPNQTKSPMSVMDRHDDYDHHAQ